MASIIEIPKESKRFKEIRPGAVFSGKWFTGRVEVMQINRAENILKVKLSNGHPNSMWNEDWDLEIVEIGFRTGDYFWKDDFPGYPERFHGPGDGELRADFRIWSGGHFPEECSRQEIAIYSNAALSTDLGYTSKEAYDVLIDMHLCVGDK